MVYDIPPLPIRAAELLGIAAGVVYKLEKLCLGDRVKVISAITNALKCGKDEV